MTKFKKGDKARKYGDTYYGTVTNVRERGVAGSAVTYHEWIEITYPNGMTLKGPPSSFEKAEE